MPRGDSLARQLELIAILGSRTEIQVPEVAAELGYTKRTVYRDLVVLQRVGVPLWQDRRGRRARWRLMEGYRSRFAVTLSFGEILALISGTKLLSGFGGTLSLDGGSALKKIERALPAELGRHAMALADRVSALSGATHDYGSTGEVVRGLADAVERRETVELRYRKPGERRWSARRVDPYHLHVQSGALYLIGWCHARKAIRTFLLDRMDEVRGTGEGFEIAPGFSPGDYLQGGFGPWTGKKQAVRLRFEAGAAPRVAEGKVHPSQANQLRSDGRLDVTLRVPVGPALTAWILGWGAAVEVIAPRALASAVEREHARAARGAGRSLEVQARSIG